VPSEDPPLSSPLPLTASLYILKGSNGNDISYLDMSAGTLIYSMFSGPRANVNLDALVSSTR
jgi:hypothetical protein